MVINIKYSKLKNKYKTFLVFGMATAIIQMEENDYYSTERVYWTNGFWVGFISGLLPGALIVGFVAILECHK